MNLYRAIKNMTIEEMADFIKPMFNECYRCEKCTDEKQRNNIIRILKEEKEYDC